MRLAGDAAVQRITKREFVALMTDIGPFESEPHLAIACSGGADSMALTLLADGWARAQGGRATALVVDHGIRTNSRKEAETVAGELKRCGVSCKVLRNTDAIGSGDIQAAARHVRYALLQDWCVANGVLHLAVAHHQEDQAETVLLRLARGSGNDGLAAMAPIAETSRIRILRPLLNVPQARLRATLAHFKAKHVEDPSNDDAHFARARMRALAPSLAAEGLTAQRLAETASRMARARNALENDVATTLGRAATVDPLGYCRVDPGYLLQVPEETALRALARLLMCVGGNAYTPRLAQLERLHEWLQSGAEGGGRTLAGCKAMRRGDELLVCREASAAIEVLPARGELVWDGRFRLRLGARRIGEVRRLGSEGWRQATDLAPALRKSSLPAAVRTALPAIWKNDSLRSVPHLGLLGKRRLRVSHHPHQVTFMPPRPLVPARFTLQKGRYTLSK